MHRWRGVGLELDQYPTDRLVARVIQDCRLHRHRPAALVDQRPRFAGQHLSAWERHTNRNRLSPPLESCALVDRDLDSAACAQSRSSPSSSSTPIPASCPAVFWAWVFFFSSAVISSPESSFASTQPDGFRLRDFTSGAPAGSCGPDRCVTRMRAGRMVVDDA